MTDNEIIKALECCAYNSVCDGCPLREFCKTAKPSEFYKLIIDLINRQKAEIERLVGVIDKTDAAYFQKVDEVKRAKAEAIKEFAERLKGKAETETYDELNPSGKMFHYEYRYVDIEDIDTVYKEMVGDNNG